MAQYSLLSKFNNYEKFFGAFQRHNVELGASFSIPILVGRSGQAAMTQAQVDIDKIRTEIGRTRSRITADLQRAYREIRRAESAQKLARADLDLARDQLTLDLTRYDEGQVTMAQVEASRAAEQEKWIAYYDTQHALGSRAAYGSEADRDAAGVASAVDTPAPGECSHLAIEADSGFHQADTDRRAGALAQPQVQIEQRTRAQRVEHFSMAALGRTV